MAHFWMVMAVPSSHVGRVTLKKVTTSLEEGLRGNRGSGEEQMVIFDGYLLHLPSLSVSGESNMGERKVAVCIKIS